MTDLPQPVRLFFENTNRGDAAGVVACFSDDARLSDWGRNFEGQAGVASWDSTDNTGVRSQLVALNVQSSGDRCTVSVRVTGDGFNGTGEMIFTLAGDRIARLDIQ